MAVIRKQFTITAPEEVMDRLEAFLAFMHYNGGHSGLFAMPFDGDGADKLKVEPPPPEKYRKPSGAIADAGGSVEIALGNGEYSSQFINYDKGTWKIRDDQKKPVKMPLSQ